MPTPRRAAALAALLLSAALPAAGCRSGPRGDVAGRVHRGRYVHPAGLFTVAVPAGLAADGVVEDRYDGPVGAVAFHDGTGRAVTLEVATAEGADQRAFLARAEAEGDWRAPLALARSTIGAALQAQGHAPRLRSQEYVPFRGGHADLFAVEVPGGSSMVEVREAGPRRLDAYRFYLCFLDGATLYQLSSEHPVGLAEDEPAFAELEAAHRAELLALAAGMTFGER